MAAPARTNDRREQRSLTVVHPPRMPYPPQAEKAGIDEGKWKALVDAVFPSAKSVDGVMLALDYCKARGLDPFKRPVHVVPMWNSALGQEVETVWPGINEIRTTASRTKAWAGNDDCAFGPTLSRPFEDKVERGRGQDRRVDTAKCGMITFPEWAQVTVYKIVGGVRVPFVGPKVRFVEAFSGIKGLRVPNDKWQKSPFQMIEKCAEAAALRRAFPEELGNELTAEEMEGKTFHGDMKTFAAVKDGGNLEPDGGEAERRPTREDFADGQNAKPKYPWSDTIQEDIDQIQKNIDLTMNPKALRDAKKQILNHESRAEWPTDALDDLNLRFDTAIARLEEGRPKGEDELPLESGDADAPKDPASPADEDEQ